jgi:uncharacterized protein YcfL
MTRNALFVGMLSATTLAGLGGVGCKAVNETTRKQPTYEVSEVEARKVIRDGYARDYAKVVDVREARVNGDTMKVQVEIRNDNLRPGNMDYKFEWFDESGMLVNTTGAGGGWRSITILTGEQMSLVDIAPNDRCKDFRLKTERRRRK